MSRQIMRLPEIEEVTGVPQATLRFYRASGKGPRLWKLGGRIVAYRDDVQAWIDEQYEATVKEAV